MYSLLYLFSIDDVYENASELTPVKSSGQKHKDENVYENPEDSRPKVISLST